jgi:hypothetical protein
VRLAGDQPGRAQAGPALPALVRPLPPAARPRAGRLVRAARGRPLRVPPGRADLHGAPVFDGRHDPVPRRVGLLGGLEPAVPVPTGCRPGRWPPPRPAATRPAPPAASRAGWPASATARGWPASAARSSPPSPATPAGTGRTRSPAPARRSRPRCGPGSPRRRRGRARGDDLARYGSDAHLDEMIGWLADRERAARRSSSLDAVRAVLRRAS